MLIDAIPRHNFGDRRALVVPGENAASLAFCVEHWLAAAESAIAERGRFTVALSGGSTPNTIYAHLAQEHNAKRIDWSKVFLFWSDERSVPPNSPDSNYHMAMTSGLEKLAIPAKQIFRMQAEKEIETEAKNYEANITKVLAGKPFDLMMLGMGDDGHTASLFPHTKGLKVKDRLVIANFVPQKETWRMTMTYACINHALNIAIYVLGAGKKHMLKEVLLSKEDIENYPSQGVGTKEHPALWIADDAAAHLLISSLPFHRKQ